MCTPTSPETHDRLVLQPVAVVYDVAGAGEDHHLVRSATVGASVPGLILHAAGPTDDGFRTIDVWVSESAWSRYRQRLAHVFGGLLVPPVVRELRADHLITAALRPDTSVSPDPRTEPQDPDTCETGPWTWRG